VHEFGEQALYAINLRRNKVKKTVYATDGHRWVVDGQFVTTLDLRPGTTLDSRLPISRIGATEPSQFGIAHGIVYGDGTRASKGSSVVLWGKKDAELLPFFSESVKYPESRASGIKGQRVVNLPGYFKADPVPLRIPRWVVRRRRICGCQRTCGSVLL